MAGVLIRRGDIVAVVVPGAYGKPRPALVVQSDLFSALPSMTICPLTTTLRNDADLIRITIEPSAGNGLKQASQVMVDKATTVPTGKIGKIIGRTDETVVLSVDRALTLFLGLT